MDVSTFTVMSAAAFCIMLYIVREKFKNFYAFSQKLNKLPGPTYTIPFFNVPWEVLRLPKEDRLRWYEKLAEPYKEGIFRTWIGTTGMAALQKPEMVEVLLRSNTEISKATAYKYLVPWLGQGLITSGGAQWFHNRKLVIPAFHFSVLDEFVDLMIEKADILNNCIEREIKIHGDKPFDIFELTVRCALDILCETAMGVNIRAQEQIGNEYSLAIGTISGIIITRFVQPWLMWDSIFYKTKSGKAFKAAVETTHRFCKEVIERKQGERKRSHNKNNETKMKSGADENVAGGNKKRALLDLLLEANEKDKNPLTTEELRDHVNTFMFAGHDTTGALIAWTLFCLGNELDVQKKVHDELDEVLNNTDNPSTLQQFANLKYLERVIKEVLRLYPGVMSIIRHLSDDLQIGKYIVPKGTELSVEIYLMHRNPTVWPDPLRFDPDRFLPENVKARSPYAYVPFSAGPRNCVGQKYTMLEAKVVVAQILRKYTIKSVETHSTIKKQSEIILKPVDGIYVHMKRR